MTATEKILAQKIGKKEVKAGEVIQAGIDRIFIQEVGFASVFPEFSKLEKLGAKVWDPQKVVLIYDRFLPPSNVRAAELHRLMKNFAQEHDIVFYDIGRSGILHQLFVEQGYALPGHVIVGTDSHTTTHGAFGSFATGIGFTEAAYVISKGELWLRVPNSVKINITGTLGENMVGKDVFLFVAGYLGDDGALYKAVEWCGPVIDKLSISSRMTVANMTVEIGGKNAYLQPNPETLAYLEERSKQEYKVIESDADAAYDAVFDFDMTDVEPQVAIPNSPANVKPVSQVAGTPIDQVFIGSCTNGRFEDLLMAANVLKDRKVHPNVRLVVIPASQEIYGEAIKAGLLSTFVDAGAAVCTPCCGPCAGINNGILAADEVCIATSNRNFKGRMGDPNSKVYLSNAAVAAASAVAGQIINPNHKYFQSS